MSIHLTKRVLQVSVNSWRRKQGDEWIFEDIPPTSIIESCSITILVSLWICDVNFVSIWQVQTSFGRSFPRDTKDQTPPCFNFSFPGFKFVWYSYLLFYLQVPYSFCQSLPRDSEHSRVPVILVSLVLNLFGLPSCSFLYRFKPVFVNHFQETLNIAVFGYK